MADWEFAYREGWTRWTSPALPDGGQRLFTVLSPELIKGQLAEDDQLPVDYIQLADVEEAAADGAAVRVTTGEDTQLLVTDSPEEAHAWLAEIRRAVGAAGKFADADATMPVGREPSDSLAPSGTPPLAPSVAPSGVPPVYSAVGESGHYDDTAGSLGATPASAIGAPVYQQPSMSPIEVTPHYHGEDHPPGDGPSASRMPTQPPVDGELFAEPPAPLHNTSPGTVGGGPSGVRSARGESAVQSELGPSASQAAAGDTTAAGALLQQMRDQQHQQQRRRSLEAAAQPGPGLPRPEAAAGRGATPPPTPGYPPAPSYQPSVTTDAASLPPPNPLTGYGATPSHPSYHSAAAAPAPYASAPVPQAAAPAPYAAAPVRDAGGVPAHLALAPGHPGTTTTTTVLAPVGGGRFTPPAAATTTVASRSDVAAAQPPGSRSAFGRESAAGSSAPPAHPPPPAVRVLPSVAAGLQLNAGGAFNAGAASPSRPASTAGGAAAGSSAPEVAHGGLRRYLANETSNPPRQSSVSSSGLVGTPRGCAAPAPPPPTPAAGGFGTVQLQSGALAARPAPSGVAAAVPARAFTYSSAGAPDGVLPAGRVAGSSAISGPPVRATSFGSALPSVAPLSGGVRPAGAPLTPTPVAVGASNTPLRPVQYSGAVGGPPVGGAWGAAPAAAEGGGRMLVPVPPSHAANASLAPNESAVWREWVDTAGVRFVLHGPTGALYREERLDDGTPGGAFGFVVIDPGSAEVPPPPPAALVTGGVGGPTTVDVNAGEVRNVDAYGSAVPSAGGWPGVAAPSRLRSEVVQRRGARDGSSPRRFAPDFFAQPPAGVPHPYAQLHSQQYQNQPPSATPVVRGRSHVFSVGQGGDDSGVDPSVRHTVLGAPAGASGYPPPLGAADGYPHGVDASAAAAAAGMSLVPAGQQPPYSPFPSAALRAADGTLLATAPSALVSSSVGGPQLPPPAVLLSAADVDGNGANTTGTVHRQWEHVRRVLRQGRYFRKHGTTGKSSYRFVFLTGDGGHVCSVPTSDVMQHMKEVRTQRSMAAATQYFGPATRAIAVNDIRRVGHGRGEPEVQRRRGQLDPPSSLAIVGRADQLILEGASPAEAQFFSDAWNFYLYYSRPQEPRETLVPEVVAPVTHGTRGGAPF